MTDLTYKDLYQCSSVEQHYFEAPSENTPERTYVVMGSMTREGFRLVCPCPDFLSERKCPHIEGAARQLCGWIEFIDGGMVTEGRCPRGGRTAIQRRWSL